MMNFIFALCFVPLLAFAQIGALQEGDIIFHKSTSGQGPALQVLTNSPWTHTGIILKNGKNLWVMEAGSSVKLTRLQDFIGRGQRSHYIVKRLDPQVAVLNEAGRQKLREALAPMLGKDYDIWFEWSDRTIYCSELVWKAYERALGIELSKPQKFRDFPLDHPMAREMVRTRYTQQGRQLNLNEDVVTPVAVLNSPMLIEVQRNF
jgi:hypothetical protein